MNIVHFEPDSANTRYYTTLLLKVDTGHAGDKGAHWHIGEENTVSYTSYDDKREQMLEVRTHSEDGIDKIYRYQGEIEEQSAHESEVRVMDCIDCHNRATHIYQMPSPALDDSLEAGRIDESVPYIKKVTLAALEAEYDSRDTGLDGIATDIISFYQDEYPDILESRREDINRAVTVTQHIFARNIHPEMNIEWGTYPSMLGHQDDSGCFRCHGADLETEEGESIDGGCFVCPSFLAMEESSPPDFLDE